MRYNIDVINPIDYGGWDDLLVSSQEDAFFYSSAWAKVLSETYHYRPLYFVLLDNNRFLALFPIMEVKSIFTGRRGVSLPFTDYCAPIIADGMQVHDIVDFVEEYGRKCRWQYIETRGGLYPATTAATSFYRHRLKLTSDVEEMFSQFKDSTKRNIRKATREGVTVNMYRSLGAVSEYCRLHCITRKKHGLPPQPRSFFRKIHEHIISKGLGFVALARYGEKSIAGAVFFNFNGRAVYKFGASDYKYQHLRASNLVMWEAIRWYAQNGYQRLCLGRTAMDNIGLRRFKAGWGTDEEIINYYRYDLQKKTFVEERSPLKNTNRRIFSIMPVFLLRLLGKLLYKHVG